MKVFSSYKEDGLLWFRVFGRGLSIKDINKFPLLFSERYGLTSRLQFKQWSIEFLSSKFLPK